jgi:superfamily I DNA/RNA helicase
MGIETESTATATQIAKEIGIDKSTLSKWRKRPDCPPLSAGSAAIKRWHDNTFLDRGPKLFDDDENHISLDDVEFTLPEGSDATDVLARMEKSERRLAGMIEAWESQKLTPKQSSKLAQLRREYRETSKLVIAAHKAILEMEQQKKVLVEWETANEFVMAVLEEVLKFPRRIPARGEDQSERDLLKKVAADFQQVVSETSKTAAQKVRQ